MWLKESEEERKIHVAVEKVSNWIISKLKDNGLLTLYLAGTIMDRDERVATSDIDFFAIVSSDFDINKEREYNAVLSSKRMELCEGYECRIRFFPLCSLQGGEIKGVLNVLKPERIVQKLPFYKILWGKKWNYKEDFIEPMALKNEAKLLITQIKVSIRHIKSGQEKFALTYFPKLVIELVRVEAQIFHNFEYHPGRKKLAEHLSEDKEHIVHKAMELRNKDMTREELLIFVQEVEQYISDLQDQINQ